MASILTGNTYPGLAAVLTQGPFRRKKIQGFTMPYLRHRLALFLAVTLGSPLLLKAGFDPARAAPTSEGAANILTGRAASGDWRADAPGVWRKITSADLPPAYATPSARNTTKIGPRPTGAKPKVPPGFTVSPLVTGLSGPRLMRAAPNGDIFVAESLAGRIRVLRLPARPDQSVATTVFAEGLDQPFGIAFFPPGPNPEWVYIANNNTVVRYPYQIGDQTAQGAPQTIVSQITTSIGGHWTRDIAFSPDGSKMYVSVGSGSNVAEHMEKKPLADAIAYDAEHGLGATWGSETNKADILTFTPMGGEPRPYATGIRNCVALTPNPLTHDLWCATNERDGLGDNLVPDYATRVKPGGFYGWPWFYIGGVEDPRLKGERPDLAKATQTPDVLFQSHSAPLGLVFYPEHAAGNAAFPADYAGDAFVALHGSWNRSLRTGYKVVRLKLINGVPTGAYQDFLTGFVIDDASVWGRPVGVVVAKDGSLLVSEDANGVIWRVAYGSSKP